MAEWSVWFYALIALLPALAVAFAVLYGGYVAYEVRTLRERRALEPKPLMPDPVIELAALNTQIERELAEAAATLAKTRATIERGTRG